MSPHELANIANIAKDSGPPSRRKPDGSLLDAFSRHTRLKPALLVILPIAGAVGAIGLSYSVAMAAVAAPLAAAGATLLLAQLGRDFGYQKQPYLFKLWGGKPSTAMLRHADGRLNPITKARYLEKASAFLNQPAPDVDGEKANPEAADVFYEAFGDLMREKTRDKSRFPLIYQELINYDYRRNLWGMKPLGMSIASISIALQVAFAVLALMGKADRPGAADMSFLVLDVFILACWLFLITPNWVRVAANAYAERLLAASEKL